MADLLLKHKDADADFLNAEVIQGFISYYNGVSRRVEKGETALLLASNGGHEKLADLLKRKQAELGASADADKSKSKRRSVAKVKQKAADRLIV